MDWSEGMAPAQGRVIFCIDPTPQTFRLSTGYLIEYRRRYSRSSRARRFLNVLSDDPLELES